MVFTASPSSSGARGRAQQRRKILGELVVPDPVEAVPVRKPRAVPPGVGNPQLGAAVYRGKRERDHGLPELSRPPAPEQPGRLHVEHLAVDDAEAGPRVKGELVAGPRSEV